MTDTTHSEATHSEVSKPNRIFLDKSVHFFAPDGSPVVTAPGDYQVQAAASALRLIPETEQNSTGLLIDAITADFDVEVHEPVTLAVRYREVEYHIVLLVPGEKAIEAVGSSSGILTRGTVYKSLTAEQVKEALRVKRTSPR